MLPLEIQEFADKLMSEGRNKRRKAHIRTSSNIKRNQSKEGYKNNLISRYSFSRGRQNSVNFNKISKRRRQNKIGRKTRKANHKN